MKKKTPPEVEFSKEKIPLTTMMKLAVNTSPIKNKSSKIYYNQKGEIITDKKAINSFLRKIKKPLPGTVNIIDGSFL